MNMLIGIDGGGTHCRARARLPDGTPIGEARGERANLLAGIDEAVASIVDVAATALRAGGIPSGELARCHAGLGIAGANVPSLADALRSAALPFASWSVESDAELACRGAFPDRDGAIAILGTGSAYVLRRGDRFTALGGWGMVVSDQGSGADLGRAALTQALLAYDGVIPRTTFCDAMLDAFGGRADAIALFADTALPREFGRFAPWVCEHADAGDEAAMAILRRAAAEVERMLRRLIDLGAPAIALLGGLGPRYASLLSPDLHTRLTDPAGDAMEGGIARAQALLATSPAEAALGGRA